MFLHNESMNWATAIGIFILWALGEMSLKPFSTQQDKKACAREREKKKSAEGINANLLPFLRLMK